jgi:ABC-type Co2+ transport system permease subunit
MARIRAIDWLGLLQRGLNTAIDAVRRAFAGLDLTSLLRPVRWTGALLARLGGAINQIIARFTGLDIGAHLRAIDWLGLARRGLSAAIDAVRRAFAGIDLFDAGRKALQSFWNGLKALMGSMAGYVRRKIASIFTMPSWMKKWFGGSRSPAAQPPAQPQARAAGGSFGPGALLVGESGPELIYASRGGWVAHNDNLRRIIGLSRRAAASVAAVSLAGHMMLTPPRVFPASPSPEAMAAAPARGASATGGGRQVHITYAPQVTVQGEASPAAIREALDRHLDELLDRLERRRRERERLEF